MLVRSMTFGIGARELRKKKPEKSPEKCPAQTELQRTAAGEAWWWSIAVLNSYKILFHLSGGFWHIGQVYNT